MADHRFGGLITETDRVCDGLYMGAAPRPDTRIGMDLLVLCAKEYQPRGVWHGIEVIHVPLDDSFAPMTREEKHGARVAAYLVARALRSGKSVLVTCAQGRNRSGLVSALALMELGCDADRAIELVRLARGPNALSNPQFVGFIRSRARRAA